MDKQMHTPGPWRLDGITIVAGDVPIAQTDDYGKSEDERRANGRLLAAAPTMLIGLEESAIALRGGRKDLALQLLDAAIAKAKGQ